MKIESYVITIIIKRIILFFLFRIYEIFFFIEVMKLKTLYIYSKLIHIIEKFGHLYTMSFVYILSFIFYI